MSDFIQDINGKWKMTGVKHNITDVDLTITAHFKYKGGQEKTFSITKTESTVSTEWETPLGVKISLTDIDMQCEDKIIGNKRYTVTNYSFGTPQEYPNVTRNLAISGNNEVPFQGQVQLAAQYTVKVGNNTEYETNATNGAEWEVVNGPAQIIGKGLVKNNNTGNSPVSATIKATYNGAEKTYSLELKGSGDAEVVTINVSGGFAQERE